MAYGGMVVHGGNRMFIGYGLVVYGMVMWYNDHLRPSPKSAFLCILICGIWWYMVVCLPFPVMGGSVDVAHDWMALSM